MSRPRKAARRGRKERCLDRARGRSRLRHLSRGGRNAAAGGIPGREDARKPSWPRLKDMGNKQARERSCRFSPEAVPSRLSKAVRSIAGRASKDPARRPARFLVPRGRPEVGYEPGSRTKALASDRSTTRGTLRIHTGIDMFGVHGAAHGVAHDRLAAGLCLLRLDGGHGWKRDSAASRIRSCADEVEKAPFGCDECACCSEMEDGR